MDFRRKVKRIGSYNAEETLRDKFIIIYSGKKECHEDNDMKIRSQKKISTEFQKNFVWHLFG